MRKQPDITDATRTAFIDSFIRLYGQKPIEKITVREITELAGYNRTTFYLYFNDIDGLYSYMEDFIFSQISGRIITNVKHGYMEQEFIQTFNDIYSEWKSYLMVLLDDPYSARFTKRIKKEIVNNIMQGLHLPADNVRAHYLIEFYLSAVLSVISRWLKNQQDMTPDEIAAFLREMLTNGILPLISKYGNND